MNRSETTAMLSRLVEKRCASRYQLWASEVSFDKGTPSEIRVDYMGFKPYFAQCTMRNTSCVELGTFDAYEVKSCLADFDSGYGLNFIGDHNYLVCTAELAEQIAGSPKLCGVDAVLVPDKPQGKLITKYEPASYGSRREHPASEMLWQMVKAYSMRMEEEK